MEKYLEEHLPDYLNKYAISQPSSRPSRKPTPTKPEKEFWFIRERAKYLGIEITANQLLHIEMYAKDAYKQRHRTLPKTQIYRGTQTYAYPKQDLDILDESIRKVTAW